MKTATLYYEAIGYAPDETRLISTRYFYPDGQSKTRVFQWEAGKFYECRPGKDADGDRTWEPSAPASWGEIEQLARDGWNVFSHPNHVAGGLGNKHAQCFTSLFYEIDDGSIEEQWQKIAYLKSLGLAPAVVVFSGGKSLHVYIRLENPVNAERWLKLNRMLTIVMNGDPAINTLARAMRLPGVVRVKNGQQNEVAILESSEAQYSAEFIESALAFKSPHGLSDERWRLWRKHRIAKEFEKAETVLVTPEVELFPKREYTPREVVHCSGDCPPIPLENCISKANRELLELGGVEGDRDNGGLRLAKDLIGCADWLAREGERYAGDPRQLFDDYVARSGLSPRDGDRIWRSASRGNPTPARKDLTDTIGWWRWQHRDPKTDAPGGSRLRDRPEKTSNHPKQITREQWWQRFGFDREVSSFAEWVGKSIEKLVEPPTFKGFGAKPEAKKVGKTDTAAPITPPTSAIVLYDPHWKERSSWRYQVDPATGERVWLSRQPLDREAWLALGQPVWVVPAGESFDAAIEGFQDFKYVLNTDHAGSGKSHRTGQYAERFLELANGLGIEGDKPPQVVYLSQDHTNPTTLTIEKTFENYEPRHSGMVLDRDRRTQLGKSHQRHAKKGETPEVPANCKYSGSFNKARELGYSIYGGKNSPICGNCSEFDTRLGGCGLILRQRSQRQEPFLRMHIDQAGKLRANSVAIVDEPSKHLQGTKSRKISIAQIQKEAGDLSLKEPGLYAKVYPAVVAVFEALNSVLGSDNAKFHGIPHVEMIERLPNRSDLEACLWEHQQHATGDYWSLPSIDDVRNMVAQALRPELNTLFHPSQTSDDRENQLDTISAGWLIDVLDAILGDNRISLSVDRAGNLVVTKPQRRHANSLKSAGRALFLDATASKADLTLTLGVPKSEILEVREVRPSYSSLSIVKIDGVGACGAQRREGRFGQAERIDAAIGKIKKLSEGKSVAILDTKTATEAREGSVLGSDVISGYHHRDGRGTNRFEDCDVLSIVGSPIPNLGQLAAQWQALTGEAVEPAQLDGRYGAWVRRQVNAEIVQELARLRSHRTPERKKTVFLLGNQDLIAIAPYYPGADLSRCEAYDFEPSCATKGEQRRRGLIDYLWAVVKERGKAPTIDEVAAAFATCKSNVSKQVKDATGKGFKWLKESSLLLFKALNNKSELSEMAISSLDPEVRDFAFTWLPIVAEGSPEEIAAEVYEQLRRDPRILYRALAVASPVVQSKILSAFLLLLPDCILDLVRKIPIPTAA